MYVLWVIDDWFVLGLREDQASFIKLPWPLKEGWYKNLPVVEYDSFQEESCSFSTQQGNDINQQGSNINASFIPPLAEVNVKILYRVCKGRAYSWRDMLLFFIDPTFPFSEGILQTVIASVFPVEAVVDMKGKVPAASSSKKRKTPPMSKHLAPPTSSLFVKEPQNVLMQWFSKLLAKILWPVSALEELVNHHPLSPATLRRENAKLSRLYKATAQIRG